MKDDPYHDVKIIHKAKLISSEGDISPLCAGKPRKLDLRKETWTFNPNVVTCRRCKAKLEGAIQ